MISLLDTSLWVDFVRPRSPRRLKQFVVPYILHPTAHLAEPIIFEILRHAAPREVSPLRQQFSTMPMLTSPDDLWERAAGVGRACRQKGHTVGSLDLLIAGVALSHDAVLVTFDRDFEKIGECAGLQVKLLSRSGVH